MTLSLGVICHHLFVVWTYANPPWVCRVISIMYPEYVSSILIHQCEHKQLTPSMQDL
jgi:hypothetical protein